MFFLVITKPSSLQLRVPYKLVQGPWKANPSWRAPHVLTWSPALGWWSRLFPERTDFGLWPVKQIVLPSRCRGSGGILDRGPEHLWSGSCLLPSPFPLCRLLSTGSLLPQQTWNKFLLAPPLLWPLHFPAFTLLSPGGLAAHPAVVPQPLASSECQKFMHWFQDLPSLTAAPPAPGTQQAVERIWRNTFTQIPLP